MTERDDSKTTTQSLAEIRAIMANNVPSSEISVLALNKLFKKIGSHTRTLLRNEVSDG